MQPQDLQQISNLLDERFKENNKIFGKELASKLDERFKENNKIFGKELASKLDERFKKNNKTLKEEIVDEIGAITNQAFNELEERMNKKFDKVYRELAKRPTKNEIFSWANKKIVPLELDMDKVKYLHLDKWNKLPPTIEISRTLVENKLKKRQ